MYACVSHLILGAVCESEYTWALHSYGDSPCQTHHPRISGSGMRLQFPWVPLKQAACGWTMASEVTTDAEPHTCTPEKSEQWSLPRTYPTDTRGIRKSKMGMCLYIKLLCFHRNLLLGGCVSSQFVHTNVSMTVCVFHGPIKNFMNYAVKSSVCIFSL